MKQNFNGSNTFGTMKICSRQGLFELISVNYSTRPRGYKTFFMLKSVKHEMLNAHKYINIKKFGSF